MYLHLGAGVILDERNIVGVFDLDNTTVSKKVRQYLSNKEKKGKIISVTDKIPKSYVLYVEGKDEKLYISQMSTSTLLKRSLLVNSDSVDN